MKLNVKLAVLAFALVLNISRPIAAGPFEDAQAAYEKKDYATALTIWRVLAEQGNADAQVSLGQMHSLGQGVPQDRAAAVRWYRLAADKGNARAQFYLGVSYSFGAAVSPDSAAAIKWFRRAADQGHGLAQQELGNRYRLGFGLPQDYVQAYMWYEVIILSPERGEDFEDSNRRNAVWNRDEIARRMKPADIARAQRLARDWRPTPEVATKP